MSCRGQISTVWCRYATVNILLNTPKTVYNTPAEDLMAVFAQVVILNYDKLSNLSIFLYMYV